MYRAKRTIAELVETDRAKGKDLYSTVLRSVSKLKERLTPEGLLALIHSELLSLLSNDAETIAKQKQVQWRIVNYAILIDAALFSAVNLITNGTAALRTSCAILGIVVSTLITVVATLMLWKTDQDLKYYRLCSKYHKELKNEITGLHKSVEGKVASENKGLEDKPDDLKSEQQNFAYFSIWFYAIIWVADLVADCLILYKGIVN